MREIRQVKEPTFSRPVANGKKAGDPAAALKTMVYAAMAALTVFSVSTLRFSYNLADMRGHALGIVGALLMLQTELTYTWRKKRLFTTGSPRRWLQLHIVTGLVGPGLILQHAGFVFSGFAGVVAVLTILVTISGVFGRYVYRLIPRTLHGEERTLDDVTREQKELEAELRAIMADEPEALEAILDLEILVARGRGLAGIFFATRDYWRARWRIRSRIASLGRRHFAAYKELESTALNRLALERRVVVLDRSKRLLANWRQLHQPLTLSLFYAIALHVAMALYYGRSF